jgi:hypothetical protein
MKKLTTFLFLIGLVWAVPQVQGAITIEVGDHLLVPNMAGQTIEIRVSGGDAVEGLNLDVQVGDGGAELGGTQDGPVITGADVLTGTIFSGNNTGQRNPGSYGQLAIRSTTTASGTVEATGLLVTITVDTTGFASGAWNLRLSGTLNGDTDFAGVSATIVNGTITVGLKPAIATEPEDKRVIVGTDTSFTVLATGDPLLSYQWYANSGVLTDETNAVLSLTNVTYEAAGSYWAVVTNNLGSVTSRVARLEVASSILTVQPPASPDEVMTSGFTLLVEGEMDKFYRIEVSANLAAWTIWTNFVGSASAQHFLDTEAINHTRRFYRIVSEPTD